ncbi:hypothetical protein [Mycobacterium sp. IDR2000157661]|uniref:hypothetical protein n=1 Tax=Mycobacterium sp. IDR2000157661 TaxID=2867005 RepID=UPI001EECBB90|nr:hypothetical protein [Mycobacterium sp. IDR2000157661]
MTSGLAPATFVAPPEWLIVTSGELPLRKVSVIAVEPVALAAVDVSACSATVLVADVGSGAVAAAGALESGIPSPAS